MAVTDLGPIARLPRLEVLNIRDTDVHDEGDARPLGYAQLESRIYQDGDLARALGLE